MRSTLYGHILDLRYLLDQESNFVEDFVLAEATALLYNGKSKILKHTQSSSDTSENQIKNIIANERIKYPLHASKHTLAGAFSTSRLTISAVDFCSTT